VRCEKVERRSQEHTTGIYTQTESDSELVSEIGIRALQGIADTSRRLNSDPVLEGNCIQICDLGRLLPVEAKMRCGLFYSLLITEASRCATLPSYVSSKEETSRRLQHTPKRECLIRRYSSRQLASARSPDQF
jgi:hypothetical protein